MSTSHGSMSHGSIVTAHRPLRPEKPAETPQIARIEADLDLKRQRIAGLVDELADRLSPSRLAQEGLSRSLQSGPVRKAASVARETYAQNPVAVGLAALALGYVLYQGTVTYLDQQDERLDPDGGATDSLSG